MLRAYVGHSRLKENAKKCGISSMKLTVKGIKNVRCTTTYLSTAVKIHCIIRFLRELKLLLLLLVDYSPIFLGCHVWHGEKCP